MMELTDNRSVNSSQTETTGVSRKFLESLKRDLAQDPRCWTKLCVGYNQCGFSEQDYLEIAKVAIDLYPDQIDRLLVDKLSANSYYEVCKVAAKRGVFLWIKYDKLQQARINGIEDPCKDVALTALRNCSGTKWEIPSRKAILGYLKKNDLLVFAFDEIMKEFSHKLSSIIQPVQQASK